MATIQEELVLVDRFSPTFARYNQMAAVASGQTTMAAAAATNYQSVLTGLDRRLISLNAQWQSAYQQQRQMVDAGVQSGAAFEQLDAKLDSLGATIRDLNTQYDMVEQQMREAQGAATGAAAAQGEYNAEMVAGKTAAGGLTGSLRGLLGTLISIQGVKAVLGLSDEMAQTSARLDRVNAQYGTTVDFNQMIYQSAQASGERTRIWRILFLSWVPRRRRHLRVPRKYSRLQSSSTSSMFCRVCRQKMRRRLHTS